MKSPPAECRRARDLLLDVTLDPSRSRDLPVLVAEHFRECSGCGRYLAGVRAATGAALSESLFTQTLRRRTLGAMERELDRPSWLAPLLLPASTAGLAALLFPVWLLAGLLRPLLGSAWLSAGVALAVSFSAGLAAAGLGFTVLIHRRGTRPVPAASGHFIQEKFHE